MCYLLFSSDIYILVHTSTAACSYEMDTVILAVN
mgnify:CR=1 FL=1